jgi:hypothetical protein
VVGGSGGANWTNPSNILIDDGNYAVAGIEASVPVLSVNVTFAGAYLTNTPPFVMFSGNGAGAAGTAVMVTGHFGLWYVDHIVMTSSGSYSGPVTVTFVGGSIVELATGTAVLGGPTLVTKDLDLTHFGWSVPSTSTPQGFVVTVYGYVTAPVNVIVTMLKHGNPVGESRSVSFSSTSASSVTLGSINDLFGAGWSYSDLNDVDFGISIRAAGVDSSTVSIGYATLEVFLLPDQTNFQFVQTFTAQDGSVRNLLLDASGNFWVEDVTNNPGNLTLAIEGINAAHAVAVQGEGTEYVAFNDGQQGSDLPRQYNPKWIDKITQVGPGASPVFTANIATEDVFTIDSITQPAQMSDPADSGHFQALLWSNGPGSATAGQVVTVYYSNKSDGHAQDADLVAAFNSGQAVYVYMSSLPSPWVDGTYQVTSVGQAIPPHGSGVRYYFTYQVPTSAYQFLGGPDTATGYYQQTLSTMTMTDPVPGLTVGNVVTIAGASVADYNTAWTISQTLNSGAMAITQTEVSGGVATYSYSLSSGVAPFASQPVTVTGTTNSNGALNVVNAIIATASGGSTGTFTIDLSAVDAVASVESGQATTAGTIFTFDPGQTTVGTITIPIYGGSTGGTLTFGGNGQFTGPGTRQGVVFFITRNGYYTAPSPPVTFTCPNNTLSINATLIPIGPPNVVARGIAFTEAGANGVPGANFFNIPTQVDYIVENVKYVADSLIINDNITTSATFAFSDNVLLESRAIDIYGYNLFNQIEIGNPGWIVGYSSRNLYGLCQNKVQNFNNLSFDGGYLPGKAVPLGWTIPDTFGELLPSPVFGNSYYIKNTSIAEQPIAGLIQQTAFQDADQQPILNANTLYSLRITARIPSGNTNGQLTIDIYSQGVIAGAVGIPFSDLTTDMRIYTVPLLTTAFETIDPSCTLRLYTQILGVNADVEIDRIEIFPTEIPVLGTTIYASYAGLPEQVDAITGQGRFISENQQRVMGGTVMYDTFYGLKGEGPNASMYAWQASPNLEPSDWEEPEVAQRAGSCGTMAFDFGEQWIVMACRNGLYIYEGGQPGKIMQEIYQVWDAINWEAADTIWVRNDVTGRRLFVGVPLPTPNFWLPNAPAPNDTLTITSLIISPFHVSPNPPDAHLSITFIEVPPEITAGQTYTLQGLTSQTNLNEMSVIPLSITGKTVTFIVPGSYFPFSGAETGTAFVSPVQVTSPNVILMLNYQGLDSGREIQGQPGINSSVYGNLDALDMRRKWTIWQIPSPYGAFVTTSTDKGFYICNGQHNSKVYLLDPTSTTDDGVEINSLYTTAGLGNAKEQMQALGAGRKRTGYMTLNASGAGNLTVRFLPNQLIGPTNVSNGYHPWSVPGGFNLTPVCLNDREASVNFCATRTFVELSGSNWTASAMTLLMKPDVWNQLTGRK